jgi:hypothetical protein
VLILFTFFAFFQETCSASTMSALASLAIEAQNVPIEKTALMENASEVEEVTTTQKLATTMMSVQPATKHIYVLREGMISIWACSYPLY